MMHEARFFSNDARVVVVIIDIAPEPAKAKVTMLWRLQIQDVQVSDISLKCGLYSKNLRKVDLTAQVQGISSIRFNICRTIAGKA